jgi:hypothetical protein
MGGYPCLVGAVGVKPSVNKMRNRYVWVIAMTCCVMKGIATTLAAEKSFQEILRDGSQFGGFATAQDGLVGAQDGSVFG